MRLHILAILFTIAQFASGQNTNKGIQVTGTAERSLKADLILLDIEVTAEAEIAAEAQKETSRKAETVLNYLKGLDAVKKVETSYIYLRPMHIGEDNKPLRYFSSQGISFQITNMKMYDEIMSNLLNKGVNGINSLRFDSSQREDLEKELLAEAIADAREKANFIASQLEQSAGKAIYISDQAGGMNGPVAYRQMDMMESSSIEPRELKIRSEVNVIFELN